MLDVTGEARAKKAGQQQASIEESDSASGADALLITDLNRGMSHSSVLKCALRPSLLNLSVFLMSGRPKRCLPLAGCSPHPAALAVSLLLLHDLQVPQAHEMRGHSRKAGCG